MQPRSTNSIIKLKSYREKKRDNFNLTKSHKYYSP